MFASCFKTIVQQYAVEMWQLPLLQGRIHGKALSTAYIQLHKLSAKYIGEAYKELTFCHYKLSKCT